MKELFAAIKTRFDVANDFNTAIGGRLYLQNAPQGATLPYAVYFLISNPVDYNFTSVFDNPQIQFSLFSEADENAEILDMHQKLKAHFDDCVLTVSGHDFIKMERQFDLGPSKDPEFEVWNFPVQYEIWLRK
jgi:hypothetical protein